MEQNQRVIDLFNSGHTYPQIKEILKNEWGEHALKRSAIYKWMKNATLGMLVAFDARGGDRRSDESIDAQILSTLDEYPFASSRMIASILNIWQSRVLSRLHSLGLVFKYTKWIPHTLTKSLQLRRFNEVKDLHFFLKRRKQNNWDGLVTGDQSWFFLSYPHKGKWCTPEEESPQEVSQACNWNKIMVTILWSVNGFHVVNAKPTSVRFNSSYMCDIILPELLEKKHEFMCNPNENPIYIHLDNCRVHNSKKTNCFFISKNILRVIHPPYSPDIAPSDFFLFFSQS